MIHPLGIAEGTNITIVNDLGVCTEYKVIKAELEMHQSYDFFKVSFVNPTDSVCKTVSMYADQIEVFDTETEALIDIYDLT